MKLKLRYWGEMLLLVSICALVSCTKKGAEPKIQPGNLSDPVYLEALNATSESAELSGLAVAFAVDLVYYYLDFSPQRTAGPLCHVETYAYQNGWHQVSYSDVNCDPNNYVTSVDSFQIKNKAGEPQQTVDTTDLGSVEVRLKLRLVSSSIYADFLGEANVTGNIIFNSIDNNAVTINGTIQEDAKGSFLHPDSGVWCSLDRAVDYDLNDVRIPITNSATVSCLGTTGSLIGTAFLDIVCPFESDTFQVSGVWSTTVTSNTQIVSVVTQHGQTVWTQSFSQAQVCVEGTRSGSKLRASLREIF